MIKFKFSNYFLIVKTICFLLIFNSSNVFGEKNKNFENAIINALENSSKIKSAKYLYESKKKLVGNAYSNSDWTSSFTSSYSNNNKLYDHEGSYLNEETNSNTLSISKNIFDSGVTKSSVSIAKNNVKIEKNNFLLIKQQLILETVNTYLNLYKYNKILQLRKTNVDKFSLHVAASKLKLKAGAITPTTVAQAESRLARAEYQLILTKSERENYKNEFLSIVGNDFEIENLSLPKDDLRLPKNLNQAISLALKNNPLILNSKINKNTALLKQNKQIFLNKPTLDIDFNYKSSESSSTSSSNDFSSYGTVLKFKTPLFYKQSEKHLILSLNDEYNSHLQDEKEVIRKVKLNVSSAFNDYKNSFLNTIAVLKEIKAAKLALQGVKKEEEFGIRTLLDVLDNEVDVIDAEVNLLKSKSNEVLKKFNLKLAIGTLRISDVVKDFKIKYPEKDIFEIPSIIQFSN